MRDSVYGMAVLIKIRYLTKIFMGTVELIGLMNHIIATLGRASCQELCG